MSLWVQNLLEGVESKDSMDLPGSDFPLKVRSSVEWADNAIKNIDEFLVDHAACERKASATAMAFVVKYPDRPEFVEAMIQVAIEELEHFHQVFRILRSRNLRLGPDTKNAYANRLLSFIREVPEERFLDRMLCFGIIEARGCERFSMIGEALDRACREPELAVFYKRLAREEAKHFGLFLRYGLAYFPKEVVEKRLQELFAIEAEIIKQLPWRYALH
jgi:tRNA 2-(methylsulfanyl)-N6-isopentenyladenosine37 hydroxylase